PRELASATCSIQCIGPRVRPRDEFGSSSRWFLDRLVYHPRREWELLRWLGRDPGCRIVHLQEIHELTGPVTTWFIRRVLGRRLLYTMHNVLSHRPRGRVARVLEIAWTRRLLLQTDAVIVHGEHLKERLLRLYRLPPDKVLSIP